MSTPRERPIVQARDEWRRGWPVVLASAAGYGATTVHVYSLGAVVKPLHAAFGWSRGEITGPMIFIGVSGLLLNPLVGRLVDKVGARRVALAAIWAYAGALAAIGMSGPQLWTWYATWALLAVLYPFVSLIVWTTPVVEEFRRHRGLALGTLVCGGGLASAATPFVTVAAIERFGWRGAYLTLAALTLPFVLAVALPFFRSRRASGEAGAGPAAEAPIQLEGRTLREAARTGRFWVLLSALTVSGGIVSGLLVHLQPMLMDFGSPMAQAAAVAAVMGPAQIIARFAVGFLLDRFAAALVAAVAMALPALGISFLLTGHGSAATGVLAAVLLGAASGAEVDVLGYMASRYFGLRHYASIFGAMLGAFTLGYGVAPMVIGFLFDALGSYRSVLFGMIVLSLFIAASMLALWRLVRIDDDTSIRGAD